MKWGKRGSADIKRIGRIVLARIIRGAEREKRVRDGRKLKEKWGYDEHCCWERARTQFPSGRCDCVVCSLVDR